MQDVYNANLMEAQRHGHAMELDITEELPEITGDRERIVQVMMNVVSNSIKYTPDGGRIRISAGRQDRRVWMEVADNGIGIPKEDRGRIFERFYRVDKARSRESGGTGLGLSIAKEIIDRHGGHHRVGGPLRSRSDGTNHPAGGGPAPWKGISACAAADETPWSGLKPADPAAHPLRRGAHGPGADVQRAGG